MSPAAFSTVNYQYGLLQGSRKILLDYCAAIDPKDFIQPLEAFGRKDMCSLLIHIANTYIHWISRVGMQKDLAYFTEKEVSNLDQIRPLFEAVDNEVNAFIVRFKDSLLDESEWELHDDSRPLSLTPLQIITHVMTHEFHHKGQLLSMSRQMGYTPVDTDMIRS